MEFDHLFTGIGVGVHVHGQRLVEGLAVGDDGAVVEPVAGEQVPRTAGNKDPAEDRQGLGPGDVRTMPIPPAPGAVAMAAMVSVAGRAATLPSAPLS